MRMHVYVYTHTQVCSSQFVHNLFTVCLQFVHTEFIFIWYTIHNRRARLLTITTVEVNSTDSPKKFYMKGKNSMGSEKNFNPHAKNHDPIGEKIEKKGTLVAGACFFYDITPGGSHDAGENFREFIDLILYCNEKKLYSVRDKALKEVLKAIF